MFMWDSKTCKERQLVWKWKFKSKSLEGKNYGVKGKKMDERKHKWKNDKVIWDHWKSNGFKNVGVHSHCG
jgi:hypothetical protein